MIVIGNPLNKTGGVKHLKGDLVYCQYIKEICTQTKYSKKTFSNVKAKLENWI